MSEQPPAPQKVKKSLKLNNKEFKPAEQQAPVINHQLPTESSIATQQETIKPAETHKTKKSLQLKDNKPTGEHQISKPAEQKTEEKVNHVEEPQKISEPPKAVINFEVISYFLDKDVTYEAENNESKTFDKRLIVFLNRKYEQSSQKDFARNNNRNQTGKINGNSYNNNKQQYNKQGPNVPNTFPEQGISRNDSKRYTQPALTKVNSSNTPQISRQKEDDDIIAFKMKLKKNASVFTEHAKTLRTDEFKKQISEIRLDLNILTPTNFEVIKKKLFELAMTNDTLCEYVVEGIIEKARTERTYSQVYADLCKYMIESSKKFTEDKEKQKMFKNHLYTNIQQTFDGEKDIFNNKMTFAKQKQLADMKSQEEKNLYFADKKKREMLNVKFIGNLFLNKSMNFQIQTICCSELLKRFIKGYCEVSDQQRDSEEVEEAHYEDHLEALIALFEQTGQKMEEKFKEFSLKKAESSKAPSILNSIISVIEERKVGGDVLENIETLTFEEFFSIFDWLKKNKKISPRIYSLIINLLERKNEDWKERLSTQTGPQSLSNLHKKHEEELKQNQLELQKYEQKQKSSGKDRSYQKNNNNNTYDKKNKNNHNNNNNHANSKLDEKSGITRAKEFWGYLDAKVRIQEDYGVANAINDLKQLKDEVADPIVFGEILIKTVYDCNKAHKDERMQVAKEVSTIIAPDQFAKSFNERLNKSKDESSDFPLFLEFLSELFIHYYNQSLIQFNSLKIVYKPDYDEYDQEDLNYVYMSFFAECIKVLKKQENFNVQEFIQTQIDPVLKGKDTRYESWVKDNSK